MNARLPIRDDNHQLETESELFFRRQIPDGWIWDRPEPDYGADGRLGVVENNQVTGLELAVQLKASQHPSGSGVERIRLELPTYNYLMGLLNVTILVKYISSEEEAYWVLLRDVPAPRQTQQTFTIRVPRENRLSTIDWEQLRRRAADIQGVKLTAGKNAEGVE